METRDLSEARLHGENEIDNALYAVLLAAFGEDDPALRLAARLRIWDDPTPQELIDAVCDELAARGLLRYEAQRRLCATHVLAAFLDLPPAEREDLSLMAVA